MTYYELNRIERAVKVATTLTHSWFRGHPQTYNALTPRVFRPEYQSKSYRAFRPEVESSIIESFKRQAPALSPQVPDKNDHVEWLFLMQHHGTPTRLLDWSKNVLVAIYFAVNDHLDEDGELWAMYPDALNKRNFPGMPTSRNPILKFLAAEPSCTSPEKLAKQLGLRDVPQYPLALDPPMNFVRMVAQQSVFTIHTKPRDGATIPELLTDPKELVRYVVPKSHKKKILSNLADLGVTRLTLFPDLDSLSKEIVKEHHELAYEPPKPPHW